MTIRAMRRGVFLFVLFISVFFFDATANAQSVNLISNGTLESGTSVPTGWMSSYWGSPAPTFSYPSTGNAGTRGASVTLSANSTGDANWQVSAPITVTPGTTYMYSTWYNSNVASEIDAEYFSSNGSATYAWLADVPSSGGVWKQISVTFTVPSGITKAVVYQLISSKGTLTIDDVSLSAGSGIPTNPSVPTVTFSASPTSVSSGQSSTLNWSTANATSCNASGAWSGAKNTSGSQAVSPAATATYTITCTGAGGSASKSVTVTVSNSPPQSPSLTFSASLTSIASGQTSSLTWSSANVASCTASGGWSGTKSLSGSQTVAPTSNTTYTLTCTSGLGASISKSVIINVSAPTTGAFTEGMVTLSFDDSWLSQYQFALPILQSAGIKGTFYFTTQPIQEGWVDYMTPSQVQAIANAGHEIAGHTITHPSLPSLSSSAITTELVNSKNYLQSLTGRSITSLAYPYGEYNATVKTLTQQAGYTSARGVDEDALNTAKSDKYALYSSCIENTATFAQVKAQIDKAKANKQWYILCIHNVRNVNDQYTITPALLQQIVSYIKSSGIKSVTVAQGRALMN